MSDFSQRIGVTPITSAAFVDAFGLWAKCPADCVGVRVQFADAVVTEITRAEFVALSRAHNELIQMASSSPMPALL